MTEDASTEANVIFASLTLQALLEALVARGALNNADVVNVLVQSRETARSMKTPAGEQAAQMASALDQVFRKRAVN